MSKLRDPLRTAHQVFQFTGQLLRYAFSFFLALLQPKAVLTARHNSSDENSRTKLQNVVADSTGECVDGDVATCAAARVGTRLLGRQRPCRAVEQAQLVFQSVHDGTRRK